MKIIPIQKSPRLYVDEIEVIAEKIRFFIFRDNILYFFHYPEILLNRVLNFYYYIIVSKYQLG
jgi:hypothetical protein